MATYNFELNSKPNKKGLYSVFLRITENKKHKRTKTKVELESPKHWNPKAQEVRKSDPNFKKHNEELKEAKEKAIKAEQELEASKKGITPQSIATTMKAGKRVFSFIEFAEDFASRTQEAGDYRTYTKYITFLNKLKFYINGVKLNDIPSIPRKKEELSLFMSKMKADLLINDITLSFLNKFKSYLQKCPNTRKPELTLHQNTISKQFDIFKSLYNKARTELKEEGLVLRDNPFDDFVCATIETEKEKLTSEEINLLESLELEEGSLQWHTRNCFLLSYYCGGIRVGDLLQLRGSNVVFTEGKWRISYRMDKTSTAKQILLVPEALNIITQYVDLDKRTISYVFPLLDNKAAYAKATTWEEKEQLPYKVREKLLQQVNSKNTLLNKYLRTLAEMAGITKKVSMHISRHSFANIARQKKANVYDIRNVLGHSSLKVTETYLSKFDTASQDATMLQVFDGATPVDESALLQQLRSLNPDTLAALLKKLEK